MIMKQNRKKIIHSGLLFAVLGLFLLGLNSCDDSKMEWGDPYTHPEAKDMPLQLKEAISRYEALKKYAPANLKLGAGIDFNLYTTNETYRNVVNANFNDVTAGNEMKHMSIVGGNGTLNFTAADKGIALLKQNGLSVYGHTLVWSSNQNAGYLNSLIAPQRIPGPAGSNELDLKGLLDGSFTGWNPQNNPTGISIVETGGLKNDPVLRLENPKSGNEWDTQLISPEIPATIGHNYEISFWIKSEEDGGGRISFDGMVNNYPWINGDKFFYTTTSWKQFIYKQEAKAKTIKVAFDLGSFAGIYFIDINTISVVDLDAPSGEFNYVVNGDFETGDLTGWELKNLGDGISVEAEAANHGSYGLKAVSSATSRNEWDLQFANDAMALDPTKKYTFSFNIKSDIAGEGRISFPGQLNVDGKGNEYPWLDWTGSGAAAHFMTPAGVWTTVSVDIQPFSASLRLCFDIGTNASVTYYLDDIKVVAQDGGAPPSGPVIIEKTEEEKAQIIGEALESWISQMVNHFKDDVKAWDVVNEPMNEGGMVKSGIGVEQESDQFYWQDYLGKDYAVTAFKLARQYGNSDDKLFINDYNLESNPTKLQGIIDYVKYIEEKGAKVDGIGTQMHISIKSDTTMIDKMFQTLAATKKLIKVSELDIKVETKSPTLDDYAAQATMYRFVISSYLKNIPAAQQYGITVWGISDNPDEHINWIPDDAPNLFDANYARKHAYKGFADGLAGKDVSADFSGELQY